MALLLEQAIVVSSTYWIARLTLAVTTSQPFEQWLILFLLSLTLVYVATSAKNYALSAAKFLAHRRFVCAFAETFRDHATVARSQKLREERHAFVASEAWLVVEEFLDYTSLLVGLTVNVVLGVVVLGLVVSPIIILAYAVSLPVLAVGLRLSAPRLARSAHAAQSSRSALTQDLVGAWDAILIGNALNFSVWKEEFLQRHASFRRDGLRSVISVECAGGMSMALSFLPVFAVLVWILFQDSSAMPALAVAVATLPRQVQTIQNLGDCIVIAMRWPSVMAKVRGLVSALHLPAELERYTGTIRTDQIKVTSPSSKVVSLGEGYSELLDDLIPSGRWTIRGPNGSGKSSLLAVLKVRLGPRALLLPATTDMPFRSTAHKTLSSGERVMAVLGELVAHQDIDTLLLDEWDANLDGEMLFRASAMLDEIATVRRIIEVRHRSDDAATGMVL